LKNAAKRGHIWAKSGSVRKYREVEKKRFWQRPNLGQVTGAGKQTQQGHNRVKPPVGKSVTSKERQQGRGKTIDQGGYTRNKPPNKANCTDRPSYVFIGVVQPAKKVKNRGGFAGKVGV